jgi:hypothetical protein
MFSFFERTALITSAQKNIWTKGISGQSRILHNGELHNLHRPRSIYLFIVYLLTLSVTQISRFKKNEHVVNQLKIGQKVITEPQCIVEAFADHFSTIFNPSSVVISNNTQSLTSDFLNVPPISDSEVKKTIQHLSSSKSVGPDEIPSFIIKGSEIFAPLLRHF